MNLLVKRQSDNGIETLGDMLIVSETGATVFKCETLELPYKDNQKMISCIPKGVYHCEKVGASANIPYDHIAITNVPNRSGVCIHKANYVTQLRGCIAVGEKEVDINGDGTTDISNSGKTFQKLMSLLPDKFKLTIE